MSDGYNKLVFEIGFVSKKAAPNSSAKQIVEHTAKRKFYDCTSSNNIGSYVLQEQKVVKNSDIQKYMTRNGDKEAKITGLFNADGEISDEKFGSIKKHLSKTKSNIWHGFLSFDSETSKGFNKIDDGVRFIKQSFNSFLDKTHLKRDNLELFCVLHKDTDHKHIHFCFFEKEPKTVDKYGKIGYTYKGVIWEKTITNYRVNANMYLHDSKDYYTARDRAIDKLKEYKASGAKQHSNDEVKSELTQISLALPKVGRCSYNELAKTATGRLLLKRVDKLAPIVFSQDDEAFKVYKELTTQLNKRQDIFDKVVSVNAPNYTEKDKAYLPYMMKLRRDIQVRLGNQIIGIAKRMGTYLFRIRRDFVNKASKNRHLKINAKKKRGIIEREWVRSKSRLRASIERIKTDYDRDMRQIENDIARDILRGMVENEQVG